jgi:chloramphenicol-sensitive protein RarD
MMSWLKMRGAAAAAAMTDGTRGLWAMLGACIIWGLSPLFYKALATVPPLEVLAHRTLWSLGFFGAILAAQGRLRGVGRLIARRREAGLIAGAALLISTNWSGFIYAVQAGRAIEASLGYYIFPLVAVLLGIVVLGERLGPLKLAAVALAGLGVAVLTLGLGVAPWLALILAASFGAYGLLKRWVAAGPVTSVTAEVALLALPALGWLAWLHGHGLGAFGRDAVETGLLIATGPVTAGPLILFAYAAQRLAYATQGLIQYINPTLQFLIASLIFQETFTIWHGLCFALIWAALALYSAALWREERSRASRSNSAGTSSTTVT